MNLRLLCLLATATLTAFFPLKASPTPAKPNIVFFLIDDLGRNDLGCYGSDFYQTPNIDRLAAAGMKFTDAYAACPVCSPTRAAILTGKHPARLHLTDWLPGRTDRPDQKLARPVIQQQLPLAEVTLAEALKAAGYVTAHIGKWHLGGEGFEPQRQGFDVNIAGDHTGTPLSYFAPFKGARRGEPERFMPGLEQAPEGEYLTDRLTIEAERFIERHKDRPFFLYFPHYTVHIPLKAKQAMIDKHLARPSGIVHTNAIYAAMIESLDESVGRVLRKLEELRLGDRTVIFFTSDNGGLSVREGPNTPATSNAPLRDGKGYLYEGGIREPLLVKWPGVVKPGSVSHVPVTSTDFFPTILEMVGAPVAHPAPLDGVSLVPLLRQGISPKRDALYWHYPHYSNQGGQPGGAIRSGDWKLIELYEDGIWELYNLKDDPGERHNLASLEPRRAQQLGTKLDAWRRSVGAQMMLPNPDYRTHGAPKGKIVPQLRDGTVELHARDVTVHGTTVRYEPQPHKNTIGFWTKAEDWVSWDFEVTRLGTFRLEILQGCGTGSGGAEVEFAVAGQSITDVVVETGHFQNFIARPLGLVRLSAPGTYTFTVKPKTKPGKAVMDLRTVTLRPVH
jgi:arylsulfatase A